MVRLGTPIHLHTIAKITLAKNTRDLPNAIALIYVKHFIGRYQPASAELRHNYMKRNQHAYG